MKEEYENKKVMSKNLKMYMDISSKTRNDICRDLGFSYSTLTDWINGNAYPRIDKIEMLAKYFGIDKSDLIEDRSGCGEDNPELDRLLKLCDTGYKSCVIWTKDTFYQKYEQLALLDHFSNLLYQYKDILEAVNAAKLYWHQNKSDLIEFYRRRDASLTVKQIKEMFLRQELEDKLNFTANLIQNMPGYIANIEDKYESD